MSLKYNTIDLVLDHILLLENSSEKNLTQSGIIRSAFFCRIRIPNKSLNKVESINILFLNTLFLPVQAE